MQTGHAVSGVFLDRDGVLVRDVDWLRDVRQLRLLPGAAPAVSRLNKAGIPVVLVTNQSVIARQWLTAEGLAQIHAELIRRLAKAGAHLDAVYFCPHHPTEGVGEFRVQCTCRKPEPGLLLQAATDLGIVLSDSLLIGDKTTDLEAGRKAGCRTALVLSGQGRGHYRRMRSLGCEALADCVCTTLARAVDWCLSGCP